MAEEEIVKHTKKIYKTWFNKELSLWHKISEFLIEIFIIVFAVTISIWFHNRSEYTHQQESVKSFLLGLKSDLSQDIKEMNEDKISYKNQKLIFSYIILLHINELPNIDTIKKYNIWLFNTTELNPNDGRFQGFKSSGKIGTIENLEIQNDIMDLYEENIPALLASTKSYVAIKARLFDYYYTNHKRLTDSTDNYISLLKSDIVLNISSSLAHPDEVIHRYDLSIGKMKKIIAGINKEYNLTE